MNERLSRIPGRYKELTENSVEMLLSISSNTRQQKTAVFVSDLHIIGVHVIHLKSSGIKIKESDRSVVMRVVLVLSEILTSCITFGHGLGNNNRGLCA